MSNILDALVQKGVLINVSVRYWRARKKLSPEDLGLSPEQVNARLFALGHKRLLPKEALQALTLVESRAHALVEHNTFPFLNGIGHYLPNEKLDDVTGKLDDQREAFERAQSHFLDQYRDLREDAIREWRYAAYDLGVDPNMIASRIDDAFPPIHILPRKFGFDVSLFQVSLPDVPQVDLVSAVDQQELIRARAEAAASARRQIQDGCNSFVADAVAALRKQTAELCRDMLATIDSTGSVHQKTLNRLVRFIEHFKELNFADDRQMEQQLDTMRREFMNRNAAEYRDSGYARDELVSGLTALRDRATQLAREDVSDVVAGFGQLGRRRFHQAA